MRSLYVHFPFCESKCHYCDFYSLGKERTREGDEDIFEKALKNEAEQLGHLLAPELDTIFFGGGTPSMTDPESMQRALAPLWKYTQVTPHTEWTMEANPSSIHKETLSEYRDLGVNRISLGVQAMKESLLTLLGRVHSRKAVIQALENIFNSGFKNVSVDLLCGAPEQTEKDLEEALLTLTQFPIQHLSCYLLTLPPHHKMYKQLPNENDQLKHLLFIHQWMESRGFEHYEISNFARPGQRAKHNLQYWTGKSYLGLGPSAHSYDAQKQTRWKNVSSLHKYSKLLIEKKSVQEAHETLTPQQLHLEKWMLALRLEEGFPEKWLENALQKNRALLFQSKGLMEYHPSIIGNLRLTAQGFALSDQIIQSLAG